MMMVVNIFVVVVDDDDDDGGIDNVVVDDVVFSYNDFLVDYDNWFMAIMILDNQFPPLP